MPKWTPDQQTAIDDRGGALLVSAAAGSGKTAVLTERVLRRLTDENDPVDIDRLLLVTFTNAAAAEMRERIGAALGAAVAANPRDTRLRRQLFLVHRAKITTVHALCLSLAREQNPDGILADNVSKKKLRQQEKEAAEKAARDYAAKKNPELEKEDKKPLSGIAERPYCRGRAYQADRYGKRGAQKEASSGENEE